MAVAIPTATTKATSAAQIRHKPASSGGGAPVRRNDKARAASASKAAGRTGPTVSQPKVKA